MYEILTKFCRLLIGVMSLVFMTSPAISYGKKDAQYVAGSASPAVLEYVVCLEKNDAAAPKKYTIQENLDHAIAACSGLRMRLPMPPNGPDIEDLHLNILECGYRPGDASPDMGCSGN